ncbi:MAG: amidohydrolase [Dehalobacterium sp.]
MDLSGSILIKNLTYVLTMNSKRDVLRDTSIVVQDGKITGIGCFEELYNDGQTVLDGKGKIALPGFINAHAHGLSILTRGGLSPDRRLRDWLVNINRPGYEGCTLEEVKSALRAFACECICSGITTVVEMEGYQGEDFAEVLIQEFREAGLRVVYAPMINDDSMPLELRNLADLFSHRYDHVPVAATKIFETDEMLAIVEQLIKKYHCSSNDMVRVWPAIRTINEVTECAIQGLLDISKKYHTLTTIHVAESDLLESLKYGLNAIDYLASMGCLNDRMVLAHCVQVNDRDIRLIKSHGARIVHNPAANAYLGSGIAPVHKFIMAEIPVGIGLDNPNCNDGVNMFADMRLAALTQKGVNRDPACITAEKLLEMATIDGAFVLDYHDKIGSIEKGKDADLILIDTNFLNIQPIYHVPSVLVYQTKGHEIDTVMVRGRVLMHGGRLVGVDEKKVIEQLRDSSQKVIHRMNLCGFAERGWKSYSDL